MSKTNDLFDDDWMPCVGALGTVLLFFDPSTGEKIRAGIVLGFSEEKPFHVQVHFPVENRVLWFPNWYVTNPAFVKRINAVENA